MLWAQTSTPSQCRQSTWQAHPITLALCAWGSEHLPKGALADLLDVLWLITPGLKSFVEAPGQVCITLHVVSCRPALRCEAYLPAPGCRAQGQLQAQGSHSE